MANTNLAEGHEKTATGASAYQSDGLRDTDVLTSPSLTNTVENGLGNGVLATTLNQYNSADRNNPVSGNCCVRPNGTIGSTSQLYVDSGTVHLDGMFYTVGSAAVMDITAPTNYHSGYHAVPIPNGSSSTEEAILLVYVEPRNPNNIGFVYGSYVDTAAGLYPQSPSNHLVLQNTVLAAARIGRGSSGPVILSLEDKRSFIRPGPLALSNAITSGGANADRRNDFIAGFNAGNLPIANMGLLYARKPSGFITNAQGGNQSHLFWQSDAGIGLQAGGGGSYQITPVHRTAKTAPIAWSAALTLNFGTANQIIAKPLISEADGTTSLVTIRAYDSSYRLEHILVETQHYTVGSSSLTVNAPATISGASGGYLVIEYIHASHL
ncbi:MAG: hypothetical protein CML17_01060 [Pusillimonas sp.]|jgi:hypothetical protein|nr:hypothetical protein [Pusillimonas sp.]